jgi:hypothetical protein
LSTGGPVDVRSIDRLSFHTALRARSAAGRFGEWTHREQLTTRLEQVP